jgi:hypothetical protein
MSISFVIETFPRAPRKNHPPSEREMNEAVPIGKIVDDWPTSRPTATRGSPTPEWERAKCFPLLNHVHSSDVSTPPITLAYILCTHPHPPPPMAGVRDFPPTCIQAEDAKWCDNDAAYDELRVPTPAQLPQFFPLYCVSPPRCTKNTNSKTEQGRATRLMG